MLVGIQNFALVQFIQILAVAYFCLVLFVAVATRLKLKKTRIDPIIDILMCVIILIFAISLKINLST
jgi:hypothetical protein